MLKRPDGKIDGAQFLSDLSGIPKEEVVWTITRIKELKAQGKSKEEQVEIVKKEAKNKPWEKK